MLLGRLEKGVCGSNCSCNPTQEGVPQYRDEGLLSTLLVMYFKLSSKIPDQMLQDILYKHGSVLLFV